MSGLACPCCGTEVEVFPPVPAERSIWTAGVERLGTVPLEPGDAAEPVVLRPDSTRGRALRAVAERISAALAMPDERDR